CDALLCVGASRRLGLAVGASSECARPVTSDAHVRKYLRFFHPNQSDHAPTPSEYTLIATSVATEPQSPRGARYTPFSRSNKTSITPRYTAQLPPTRSQKSALGRLFHSAPAPAPHAIASHASAAGK